ncbi:MAG: DUF362 domain-containing protein [Deltaproteobacteria bacterium]|nr:DUF362 domain-containing protein [Deltaproteobacteria bacterium]
MSNTLVSVVKYEKPFESVRRAVELSMGLEHLPVNGKVFIKPNIVFWTKAANFPKYGTITTSRVVEDIIILLKERGIDNITIAEGIVLMNPKDRETPRHAFMSLGYEALEKRYGIKCMNVFERPFEPVDLGDDIQLKFNADILSCDFVVNLPVLKTHSETIVSLGIKNIKGLIDVPSRKKCHSADPEKNLDFHVARLADKMPPMFTLVDGIYTLERGPHFFGNAHRSNLLIASADVLSADLVGAKILGFDPSGVPHLVHAALNRKRPADLSDVAVVGIPPEDVAAPHEYAFPFNKDLTLPVQIEQMGVQGVSFRKTDNSLCTYCSFYPSLTLLGIAKAWNGKPWDDVEVLTGKAMAPTPGKKKTILLGKCMYKKNKEHPDIKEMIAVKECPPGPKSIVKAFHQAGIPIEPNIVYDLEGFSGRFMKRYEGNPDFDESFYRI